MEFFDDKDNLSYFLGDECADAQFDDHRYLFKSYKDMRLTYIYDCIQGIHNFISKNGYDFIEKVYLVDADMIQDDENYKGSFYIMIANKYEQSVVLRVLGNTVFLDKKRKKPFEGFFSHIWI